MTTHARLSPSAADRWMQCPGSPALIDRLGLPSSTPSTRHSTEGTFAHDIRSQALISGEDACAYIGTRATIDGYEHECTVEMAAHLQPGIERLRALGGIRLVEQRLDLRFWVPGAWGTADAVVIVGTDLHVDDLKYGQGKIVATQGNRQARLYALGALTLAPKAERIHIWIDQPRVAGGGGGETLTVGELLDWGREAKAAAEATMQPDAPLVPSEDACRWCPASAACPALTARSLEAVGIEDLGPLAPTLPAPEAVTPERRARILAARTMIEAWLERLHAAALADALAGRPDPGFKAVAGRRGARQWAEQADAARYLEAELGPAAYDRRLISPAQAEKLLGKAAKAELATLTTQAEGKPALVPATDPRPALTTADAFDAIDAGNAWE